MATDDTSDRRTRAHFIGAPFVVPAIVKGLRERFAATGYNTGNLLIGEAVARQLDVDIVSFGSGINPIALKDSVDVIVIPSANFLSPAMDLSWLFPVIEGTKHPVLMVGVGAQFPSTDVGNADLPPQTVRLMKMISDRAVSIGVRGQFTADVLAKYGIRNTRITGCPSLFRLGKETLTVRTPDPKELAPAFNGSSNVLRHAYSTKHARAVELKLLKLAIAFDAPYIFQNELPEMLLQAGESETEAMQGCESTLRSLGAELSLDNYATFVRKRGITFFNVDKWAAAMTRHNIVVGTRFHGNMIGISQGIASVFVAHDSRTTELCEALNIPFIGLEGFAESRLEDVVETLDYSAFERGYPNARRNLQSFFSENGVPTLLHQEDIDAPTYPHRDMTTPAFVPTQAAHGTGDPVDLMKRHLEARDHAAASKAYDAIPQNHAKYPGATLLLAEALVGSNPILASELAQKGILLAPKSMKSYWVCARALRNGGREDEAREVAKAGLVVDNDAHWQKELHKFLA